MTEPATNPEPARFPTLRNCVTCGAPIALARTVDNHLLWLNRAPDPAGDIRIFGPLDDQPTAMYGMPTETLGGYPLPDLTTYREHDCPGSAPATSTTADTRPAVNEVRAELEQILEDVFEGIDPEVSERVPRAIDRLAATGRLDVSGRLDDDTGRLRDMLAEARATTSDPYFVCTHCLAKRATDDKPCPCRVRVAGAADTSGDLDHWVARAKTAEAALAARDAEVRSTARRCNCETRQP